jgi:putative effector of murein hydrolase LrgA (UPF0299 family)
MSVELILTYLSCTVWAILILMAFFERGSVKIKDVPVRNPFLRAVLALFVIPIIGGVLAVVGLLGWFLLLPVLSLF